MLYTARLFLTLALLVGLANTALAGTKKNLSVSYTSGGTKGYRTPDYKTSISPVFRDAGPFNQYGMAPVTFDGINWCYINEYGMIVTEIVFDGCPRDIYKTLVCCGNARQGYNLVSTDGKHLLGPLKNMQTQQGLLTADDPRTDQRQAMDARLKPILDDNRYSSYYRIDKFNLPDTTIQMPLIVQNGPKTHNCLYAADGQEIFGNSSHQYPVTKAGHYIDRTKLLKGSHLDNRVIDWFYVVADNATGKYGVRCIDGTTVIEPKHSKPDKAAKDFTKQFKKKTAPLITDGTLPQAVKQRLSQLNDIATRTADANLEMLGLDPDAQLDILQPLYGYVSVKKNSASKKTTTKGKGKKKTTAGAVTYTLDNPCGSSTRLSSRTFAEIIDHNVHFFCRKKNQKGWYLYNCYGVQVTPEPYDEIQEGGYNASDEARFRVRKGKEWGLIDITGRELLAPQFAEIEMGSDTHKIIQAKRDGQYYLVDFEHGRMLNNIGYDKIGVEIKGKSEVQRNGFTTHIDKDGKEDPPIIYVAYEQAKAMPGDTPGKIQAYSTCIALCNPDVADDRRIIGMALNNIGVCYKHNGDLAAAKNFYEKAAQYGNTTARSNLQALNNQLNPKPAKDNSGTNLFNALSGLLGAVGGGGDGFASGLASGLQGQQSVTVTQTTTGYDTYSTTSTTNSSYGKLDEATYRRQYQRWENSAKDCYEALTREGYSNKEQTKGAYHGHHASYYSGMKRNLRNAQKEMRHVRLEAKSAGYNIPQSTYETCVVNH